MANLLILRFYNTDFRWRIFLRIFDTGLYVANFHYRILNNIDIFWRILWCDLGFIFKNIKKNTTSKNGIYRPLSLIFSDLGQIYWFWDFATRILCIELFFIFMMLDFTWRIFSVKFSKNIKYRYFWHILRRVLGRIKNIKKHNLQKWNY